MKIEKILDKANEIYNNNEVIDFAENKIIKIGKIYHDKMRKKFIIKLKSNKENFVIYLSNNKKYKLTYKDLENIIINNYEIKEQDIYISENDIMNYVKNQQL